MSKPTTGLRRAGIASFATGALALSACVVGAGAASADADFAFERLAGDNRYETAGDVYDAFGDNDSVILANGEQGHFPDALVANYLAGVEGSPILLTRSDKMPAATESRLDGGGKTITIVGGEDVVSAEQAAALEAEGHTVERLAGANRYLTAAEVIEEGGDAASNTAIITTGVDFPDALAAGPVSVDQGSPIAISRADDIRDEEVDALVASGVENFIVLGGPTIVGPAVVAELEAAGLEFNERIFGADRAATSVELAEYAIANYGFSDEAVNVASGYIAGTGADALAGGPLTGQQVRPMLITRSNTNPGDSVLAFLSENCPTLDEGIIFGGPGAVDQATEDEMTAAASNCGAGGQTDRLELSSAEILGTVTAGQATPTNPAGTTVRYTFDSAVSDASGLAPTAGEFFVYNSAGAPGEPGNDIVEVDGDSVTVRFTDINTADLADALTLATVDDGAVRETDGSTNIEGDAPLGSSTGGGSVTLPAGITDAPDLLSVGNFRQAANAGETAVDFTFDEAATTTSGDETAAPPTPATGFTLHLLDGTLVQGTAPAQNDDQAGGGTVPGGNGTTTITVIFDDPNSTGTLGAGDVARGTVDAGSVTDANSNTNVLQAADVSNSGNTTNPDLVSVELRPGASSTDPDQALFVFDESIGGATIVPGNFNLYNADGTEVPGTGLFEINTVDTNEILVDFGATATNEAVGGSIEPNAVTTTGGEANENDEVGIANTTTDPAQTAGKTDGPDLTGVSVATRTDNFGNVEGVDATYTFDEDLDTAANPTEALFHLYLADGTEVTDAATCTVGPASGTDDDNTVVCEYAGPAGDLDQALEAAVGTVDTSAVTDGTTVNPEGAEPVA